MSKYNVGDRVVIREWDDMEEEYGLTSNSSINCNCYFTTGMRYLCGREFTIRALDEPYEGSVKFEENDEWNYHIDMIRPAHHHKDLNIPSSDLIDNLIFS